MYNITSLETMTEAKLNIAHTYGNVQNVSFVKVQPKTRAGSPPKFPTYCMVDKAGKELVEFKSIDDFVKTAKILGITIKKRNSAELYD